MRVVNLREAKAHLNALIDAAQAGHQVVLMRGSTPVAQITPITEADLEVAPKLTDRQAAKLWAKRGQVRTFDSPERAVAFLRRDWEKGKGIAAKAMKAAKPTAKSDK